MRVLPLKRTLRPLLTLPILGLLLLNLMPSVRAFKPTAALRATNSDKTHAQITNEAIRELIEQEGIIPDVTRISKSMQSAIDHIKWGNANTDLSGEYFVDAAHFTGEQFGAGQGRLYNRYRSMKSSLERHDLIAARQALGEALHAIQDFYAHSNWIEAGHAVFNSNVGNFSATGALLASAVPPNYPTCVDCDPGNCAFCINNITSGSLTSAYFQTFPVVGAKPPGKCSHGGTFFDLSADNPARGGINKDTADCETSPHSYYHFSAASAAKNNTKEFIRFVRKNVTLPQFKALMGVGNTLAFAIDTTGSMTEEIAGVRQGVVQIIDSRFGTDLQPSAYVLVGINDPLSNLYVDTDDPVLMKKAVNSLAATAGGDCPELAFTGMLKALERFDEGGGELMVFSDATAKDGYFLPLVIGLAQVKKVAITTLLSGSCSPIGPDYYRVSRETGGQTFVIGGTQSYEATKLADFLVRPDAVDIAHVNGVLSATPATYTVPVDSTLTRVTFSVSGTAAVVKRPDGTTVLPTDPNVSPANISGGTILSIAGPPVGAWTVTVSGDGEFSLRVKGESPLRFSSFDVVEVAGLPGHDGYFPIPGHPIAGQPAKATAELSAGGYNTAQFELRAGDGTPLQALPIGELPNLEGNTSREYFGDLTLPAAPFLAYATGTDLNGVAFQRVLPKLITPQTVKVSAPRVRDIYPGRGAALTVQVTNHGPADTFKLDASDDHSFVRFLSPSAFALGPGETLDVTVHVEAPADVPAGTIDTLTVSAVSTGVSGTSNSAVARLTVLPELEVTPDSALGGEPSVGTVRLFEGVAPAGGTPVTLSSSNPAVASVPASVTVPAGANQASFTVTTSVVGTPTPVTVTAAYGGVSRAAVLQVTPSLDTLVSLTFEPAAVQGGDPSSGVVTLNGPAPAGGAVVTLDSDAAAAAVPATVTIPEGATSAAFPVTTTTVPAPSTADITAAHNGVSQTATLRVNPNVLGGAGLSPDDVVNGSPSTLYVTLNGPAPAGGTEVTLTSGNTSVVTVPATVTVPAGQSYVGFLNAVGTSPVTTPTTVAVIATFGGESHSAYLRVTPNPAPKTLYLDPSKLAGGRTSTGTVELNSPAPAGGALITLGSSDTAVAAVPPTVTVPAGAASADFVINTSAVSSPKTVNISAAAGGVGRTEVLTVVPTALDDLTLTPSSVGAGTTSTGRVVMSNPAPAGGTAVALSSANADVATVPAAVTIPAGETFATFPVTTANVALTSTTSITATYGEDSQAAILRVFGANDVFGTITPGGPPVAVTVTNAGQNARLVFEGTAGQRVSLKMSAVTIGNSYVSLLKPAGSTLTAPLFVGTSGGFIDATTLPETGTYTILIDPSSSYVGNMTLQLYNVPPDPVGGISLGGSATVTTTVPGQNAFLTFSGTAGQAVTVKMTGVSMGTSTCCGAYVSVANPDGTTLVSQTSVGTSGDFIDKRTLPAAGTYTIKIDPRDAATGSMTLALGLVAPDVTASLTPGGSPVTVTTTTPGQNALVSFSGSAGQRVSLKMTGVSMGTSTCCSTYVSITNPDGTTLTSPASVGTSGGFIDTKTLPAAGTYTILVDPRDDAVGSMTLTLYDVPADLNGSITPGGPPVTVSTSTPGQNARLTFGGTAGQRVSLKLSGVTMGTSTCCSTYVSVANPNGTTLVSQTSVGTSGGFIDTKTLPATGTYTILVDPRDHAAGSMTLTLYEVPPDVTAGITPGGAPVTVTAGTPGQNVYLTFGGSAGQRVSLKLSGVTIGTSTCCGAYVSITNPDGTTLLSQTSVGTSGLFIDPRTLPADGTYTILVNPRDAAVGDMTLTLYDVPPDGTGTLVLNGPNVSVLTSAPGQVTRLTFDGTAGQQVTVRVTSNTTGRVWVYLFKPDNTTLTSLLTGSSSFNLSTQTLPTTGTYTVKVDPEAANVGSLNVRVSSP